MRADPNTVTHGPAKWNARNPPMRSHMAVQTSRASRLRECGPSRRIRSSGCGEVLTGFGVCLGSAAMSVIQVCTSEYNLFREHEEQRPEQRGHDDPDQSGNDADHD